MSYADSILSDLNDSLVASQAERRVAAVRQLAGQFLDQAPHLTEAAVGLYDVALQWLVRDLDLPARIELSQQLAEIANAPRGTIHLLGEDEDSQVAAPVLERSPRFDEKTLVAIALDQGEGHLLAIAQRPRLGPAVTDILVQRGLQTVLHRLAANETAQLSPVSAEELVQRAEHDPALAHLLCRRFSLAPSHSDKISGEVKSLVRELLITSHAPERRELENHAINSALDRSMTAMNALGGPEFELAGAEPAKPEPEAAAHPDHLSSRDEQAYVALLASQQIPAALVLLAQLSGLSVDAIGRIYCGHSVETLLTVFKAAGLTWEAARATLASKLQDSSDNDSSDNGGLEAPLAEKLRRRYARLSPAEAKYALRSQFSESRPH